MEKQDDGNSNNSSLLYKNLSDLNVALKCNARPC